MRTLLVDNHDSYTYNVFHLLAAASGSEPVVVNNDAVSWRVLSRSDFDAIVLSPGPGRPERWHDFGVCRDILRYSEIPVLGICLGHQGIGNLLDGHVSSAPMAMHGRLSHVRHSDTRHLRGNPPGLLGRPLPLAGDHRPARAGRAVTAWAEDGVVMGVEHTSRPIWGVQFHPESIATEHGRAIAENFYAMASRLRGKPRAAVPSRRAENVQLPDASGPSTAIADTPMRLRLREIDGEAPTEALFERLFADAENAFWLDSADAPTRLAQSSYLGTSAGARALPARIRRRAGRGGGRARPAATPSSTSRSSTCSTAKSPSTRSSRRPSSPGDWSAASSATSAMSSRPTAARPTSTAPTCPTR